MLSLKPPILHMWNSCSRRKPFFVTLHGCAIKKAPNKPHPSAKWSGTFSTPIVGFAVASSRSKSIWTQQPSVFQGLSINSGLNLWNLGYGIGTIILKLHNYCIFSTYFFRDRAISIPPKIKKCTNGKLNAAAISGTA